MIQKAVRNGGSTAVNLFAQWCRQHNVKIGDPLDVRETENGDLLIRVVTKEGSSGVN